MKKGYIFTGILGFIAITAFMTGMVSFRSNLALATTAGCANGTTLTLAETTAALQSGKISAKVEINRTTNRAEGTIVNNTDCKVPVSQATYKMYDARQSTQEFFDATSVYTVNPRSTVKLVTSLPSCTAQVDMYYGSAPHVLYDDGRYVPITIAWAFNQWGNYCTHTPPPPPTLTATCSASPATISKGGLTTWSATATGGTGSYTYSWSGSDSLWGSSRTISKTYSTSGEKTGTVTVTSGSQNATAQCKVTVQEPAPPALALTCSASPASVRVNESVSWTANPTGGTGAYTYSWSGDGLSGTSKTVQKSYSTVGTKTASVTVTSGTQTLTRQCTVSVTAIPIPTLNGSCSASPSSVDEGDSVTWNSTATGGTGSYTYSWSGTNSLSGTSQSVQKTYSTTGTKSGTVTITSGNQSISRQCSVAINQNTVNLDAYCTASPGSAYIGNVVNWTVSPTGGTGSYSYSWNGENLSGGSQTVQSSYGSSGTKTGTVTVTSGGQSVSRQCSVYINQNVTSNLDGSCSANPSSVYVGNTVNWNANGTGGTGSYTYSWSGENISGNNQNPQVTYYTPGTRTASVVITSNGQSITRQCSVTVNQSYTSNLEASCSANPSSANVGESITWNANASGGAGSYYSYSWSGTDSLYGSYSSVSKQYQTTGQKSATVTVTSGGQSVSRTCYTNINHVPSTVTVNRTGGPTQTGGVYLSQVPYTGIGSNGKIVLFLLALLGWSGFVSYFLMRRKAKRLGISVPELIKMSEISPSFAFAMSSAFPSMKSNAVKTKAVKAVQEAKENVAPKVQFAQSMARHSTVEALETKARGLKTLVSADGLEFIAEKAEDNHQAAIAMLDQVASHYRSLDKENGGDWMVITKDKIAAVIK